MSEKLICVTCPCDEGTMIDAFLIVSKDLDLKEEHNKYRKWYYEEYCQSLITSNYISFTGWLVKNCNARDPSISDIEVFNE